MEETVSELLHGGGWVIRLETCKDGITGGVKESSPLVYDKLRGGV